MKKTTNKSSPNPKADNSTVDMSHFDRVTIAAFFSTLLGIIFNFFTIGRLVFQSKNNALFYKFVFVYGFLYLISIAGISFIHDFNISYEIAGALMIMPSAIISFVLNKNLVFKK